MSSINRNKFTDSKQHIAIIFSLALPAILENVLQVFIGIVDTYFVGKLGTEAIAAVGVTNLVMNIYIAFFTAIGVGTTAIVSRSAGAGDEDTLVKTIKQSILLSLIIGLSSSFINLVFSKNILKVLGIEAKVMNYSLPYFMAVAVPSVILSLMMVISSALRGTGDTKTPMKAVTISNIVNAVLDYVLIFGLFEFKGLGILGAGLATTISRTLGVIILLKKLKKKYYNSNFYKEWYIDKEIQTKLLKISAPSAVERLVMRIGQVVYGALIIKIGTTAYAAHNIAGNIETFSYMPAIGFAVAASTLVGQNLGAEKPEEAKQVGLLSNLLATIFMVIVGLIYYIFAPQLAGIFTKDAEVILQVTKALRIIALFQPFLSITLVITSALQGAGDTKFPMYSTFIGIWGIRVIGTYVLGIVLELGLVGVWLSYAFDIFIRSILLMVRFLKGRWMKIKI